MNEQLHSLLTRDWLPFFAGERDYRVGVEIGTFKGEFARHILTHWAGVLWTCDPFEDLPANEYLDGCFLAATAAEVHATAEEILQPWLTTFRCNLVAAKSETLAELFGENSVDFAYIDGNHDYSHARSDIETWWSKLKPGGLLGGHDFYTRNDQFQRADVANAVLDFAERIQCRPYFTPCTSWWILKP